MIDVVGLITARGGSKSIPHKNIKLLAGKPLIAWTIEAALASSSLARVIVSTDDDEIASVARTWGAEVPFMRPPELARDDTPHLLVVEHAIRWLWEHDKAGLDYALLLQPTSPLRTSADIDAAVAMAGKHAAVAVVSVCEMDRHPLISKRILEDGTLADFVTSDIPYLRRQALPPAYALNGAIYLIRCGSLIEHRTFWPQGTYAYIMPPERSLDVDSPWEFHLVELLMRDRYAHRGD
jgi:N-acylneuraminate cytidylyltransferase/CMP-N,N'-diacetyllegionaminic acid synthase